MIEAESLTRIATIRHGFFTRRGGSSAGIYATLNCGMGSADDRTAVLRNRQVVARSLGVAPERLVSAYQVHSAEVLHAAEPWAWAEAPRVDGLVTERPGLAIAVSTADCAPVLFADVSAAVIGAAHAGWRGALAGITDATLAVMERLGARRERIAAAIGPTISGTRYEVGAELRAAFLAAESRNDSFFRPAPRGGHFLFDLSAYLEARLKTQGVGSVERIERCTYRDEETFFSYRRATHRGEPDYGRQLSAIAIADRS
jgi:YfiH family protein